MLVLILIVRIQSIARGMGFLDPNKVRPRRKELLDMGLVVESGKRVCEFTGKLCYVWDVEEHVKAVVLDRKELLKLDGTIERVFKSLSLLEVLILVHNYLNKYSAKKYELILTAAGFDQGVYVVACRRKNIKVAD